MLGAIIGDVVGSIYEFDNHKSKDFPLFKDESYFTDDTVLTCATARAILDNKDYSEVYRAMGLQYPAAGYGGMFSQWLSDPFMGPYGSFGNGSAMRVSPVGWAYDSDAEVLAAAKASAESTHNHPEGIKGAQATALAIFLARNGQSPADVGKVIAEQFGYDLSPTVDELRHTYAYNETCQATVPEAMCCYLEADSFEDAIRNAISIGGDSDTLAAIAGGIAEATFGIHETIATEALQRLDEDLSSVVVRFYHEYMPRKQS
jgi:ADP-ribosylglycohydrolase